MKNTTTTTTTPEKFKIWLKVNHLSKDIVDFAAERGFNPKTTLAEGHFSYTTFVSGLLNLYTLGGQLALDMVKVVAHLADHSASPSVLEAVQKCLDDPTDENRAEAAAAGVMVPPQSGWLPRRELVVCAVHAAGNWALKAAIEANTFNVYSASKAADTAAEGRPELINKLGALKKRFKENVYNSLIIELEK